MLLNRGMIKEYLTSQSSGLSAVLRECEVFTKRIVDGTCDPTELTDVVETVTFDIAHVRGRLEEMTDVLLYEHRSSTAAEKATHSDHRSTTAEQRDRLAELSSASSSEIQNALQERLETSLRRLTR